MTPNTPYTFVVLRYVHDIVTGEFVNVGVLVTSPSGFSQLKRRTSMGRVKQAFPSVDRRSFLRAIRSVETGLRDIKKLKQAGGLFREVSDAGALSKMLVPPADGALQWSSVGGGLTDDLPETVDRLYERFVVRNDPKQDHRSRTDEDVWRPVREQLNSRDVRPNFEPATLAGNTDQITLRHAWKNGAWHAYEPLSFDLADEDGIKDKARRWRGHLEAVKEGMSEKLELSFILGSPTDLTLMPAYEKALQILEQAPFNPRLYSEDNLTELVDEIEDEVRKHERLALG